MRNPQPKSDSIDPALLKIADTEKKIMLSKIAETTSLPTPSSVLMKVMLLLRDENVNIPALVAAIERDQSICVQLIKMVNSGYYGLRNKVDSIDSAVKLLGLQQVKQLIFSVSIMDFFSPEEQVEWKHSYATSHLMNLMIRENELFSLHNLPLVMILHDLGKVILKRYSPKKHQLAVSHSLSDNLPLYRYESSIMLLDHAEAGAFLLKKWDTSEEIIKPIQYHHTEHVPSEYVFETAMVQLVDWIDNTIRGVPCFEPKNEILSAAGIAEVDRDYWIGRHEETLKQLERDDSAAAETFKAHAVPRPPSAETETISLNPKKTKVIGTPTFQPKAVPVKKAPEPAPETEGAVEPPKLTELERQFLEKLSAQTNKKETVPEDSPTGSSGSHTVIIR